MPVLVQHPQDDAEQLEDGEGAEQLSLVHLLERRLLHIEHIAPIPNMRCGDLIVGRETGPVREECRRHGRAAPDLDPHPRIGVVGIPAPMVLERHAQRGQVEQRHQHVLAVGGRYSGVSGETGGDGRLFGSLEDDIARTLANTARTLGASATASSQRLSTTSALLIVLVKVRLHHMIRNHHRLRRHFLVIQPNVEPDAPVLHEQNEGVERDQDAQEEGGQEGRGVAAGNPHALGERVQHRLLLLALLALGVLLDVHFHPVEPPHLVGGTVWVVDVRQCVLQLGPHLVGPLHDLEALPVGLLQELAVGPADGGADPSHLVHVGGGEEEVVQPDLEAFLLLAGASTGGRRQLGPVQRHRLDPLRVRLLRQLHLSFLF